jgi:hypothetical protein
MLSHCFSRLLSVCLGTWNETMPGVKHLKPLGRTSSANLPGSEGTIPERAPPVGDRGQRIEPVEWFSGAIVAEIIDKSGHKKYLVETEKNSYVTPRPSCSGCTYILSKCPDSFK